MCHRLQSCSRLCPGSEVFRSRPSTGHAATLISTRKRHPSFHVQGTILAISTTEGATDQSGGTAGGSGGAFGGTFYVRRATAADAPVAASLVTEACHVSTLHSRPSACPFASALPHRSLLLIHLFSSIFLPSCILHLVVFFYPSSISPCCSPPLLSVLLFRLLHLPFLLMSPSPAIPPLSSRCPPPAPPIALLKLLPLPSPCSSHCFCCLSTSCSAP